MVWNTKMDAEVAQLRSKGMSYSEIAICLELTKNQLIGRADRLRRMAMKKVGRSREPLGVLTGMLCVREPTDNFATKGRIPVDIPIYELQRNECRWPTSERSGTHLFCAKPTADGRSYCKQHDQLAITNMRGARVFKKVSTRILA